MEALSCRGDRGTNLLTRSDVLGDLLVRAKICEAPCSPSARFVSLLDSCLMLITGTNHIARGNLDHIKSVYRALGEKMWAQVVVLNIPLRQERLKQRWTNPTGQHLAM